MLGQSCIHNTSKFIYQLVVGSIQLTDMIGLTLSDCLFELTWESNEFM